MAAAALTADRRDTTVNPMPIVNPVTAEIAAAEAAMVEISAEVTLYAKALDVVRAKVAAIEVAEVQPIVDAVARLRDRELVAKARLDRARFLAIAPTEAERRTIFDRVRQEALLAYRAAQQNRFADKNAVEAAYAAVRDPMQRLHTTVGQPYGTTGLEVTEELIYATFYPRLSELRQTMLGFAADHSQAA